MNLSGRWMSTRNLASVRDENNCISVWHKHRDASGVAPRENDVAPARSVTEPFNSMQLGLYRRLLVIAAFRRSSLVDCGNKGRHVEWFR
jgi:hypothetical protein